MPVFIVAITAQLPPKPTKLGQIIQQKTALHAQPASTRAEAEVESLKFGLREMPKSEGWHNHKASIAEISKEGVLGLLPFARDVETIKKLPI